MCLDAVSRPHNLPLRTKSQTPIRQVRNRAICENRTRGIQRALIAHKIEMKFLFAY